YKPNGKIIPVDPNGNPIPDVPTPTYPTDPTDPTKVVPDEPVPEIPGMTPSTPTVTPEDPGKDTPVPYNPVTPAKDQIAQVIYRDVQDGANTQLSTSGNLAGKGGSEINYSTADKIKDLISKGYVLKNDGFPAGAVFDNDDNKTQIFYVDFIHGQAPVNPDNPHEGVDPSQYEKNVKETVHYEGAGDKTPADNVQTSKWTRTLTIDSVTGKIIENGQYTTDWSIAKGEKTVYDQVNTPVVDGYHADKREVSATAVTQDDIEVTVTYTPNGKIVPVDPNGNPIPDVPTPTYPTDPTDPTKVVPDEPVPEIPGLIPSTPTVTPEDPGKDTPVPYNPVTPAKDQAAIVSYVDADNGNSEITNSGNLTGKAGEKINYSTKSTIEDLVNKGYVLVNDGFPADAVYDNDENTTQRFVVVLKHGTVPVTPDKPGKPGEPINPNDPDGPKWPDGTDEKSVKRTGTQTIHYEGAGDKTPSDDVQTFD
ncbi:MAG: adhesin, partial [Lactobacillus johnsonii]|nr:adhesin [Lactobacillus johnsonii]